MLRNWLILLFWLGVLWIAYVYVGYPVVLALIGMFKRVRPQSRYDYFPTVSVLIAARNEEKDIAWKVRETLAWDYAADLQVLVASDSSEDRTDEVVRGINDPRVKLLRLATRGGKSRALNELARRAHGELLFFTDANAHIDASVLRRMVRHFADPRVGCVTGITTSSNADNGAAVARGAAWYWGYESLLQYLESRLGSVLVCDGAIFCIRRSLFCPLLPDIANDLQTPNDVAHYGFWVIYEPGALVVEADTTSPREELKRRRRICGQGALGWIKLSKQMSGLRKWQFLSHKVLRWLTLIPMLLVLCSSIALARTPIFLVFSAVQLATYLMALLGWIWSGRSRVVPRWASVPFYVVLGMIGALLGIVDTALGRRFSVWEIPTFSRGQEGA